MNEATSNQEVKEVFHKDPLSILEAIENDQGLLELWVKIEPLIAGNRLHNIVDLWSLVSDMIDLTDNAMVEKLSNLFEGVVTVGWEGGSALSMAHGELEHHSDKMSLRSVFTLLRHPDTLRGITLLLRTLQIVGGRIKGPAAKKG